MITKENFIKNTDKDELFSVFHSILMRINAKKKVKVILLDKEIINAVEDLIKTYQE